MRNPVRVRAIIRTFVLAAVVAAVTPGGAVLSNYYLEGDFGAGRCASARGNVPSGSYSLLICNELYASAYGLPSPNPSSPVWGRVSVHTTHGYDSAYFRFEPSSPDARLLTALVMDPSMSLAQITFTEGTITANLVLNGTGTPFPFQDAGIGHEVGTGAYVCGGAGGEAGASRPASVSSGFVRSTRVGGGSVSATSARLSTGFGGGQYACVWG